MIDSDSLMGGGGVAAAVMFGKYVYNLIRANMKNKAADTKRDGKYVDDCERRYTELSATIDKMRANYETNTVSALLESARAMSTAAEVQREGNILQREQTQVSRETTRILDRVCRVLELEKSPTKGSPITKETA